jgi:hypothetical protein
MPPVVDPVDVDIRVEEDATHSGEDPSDASLATDGSERLTRSFLGKYQVQRSFEGFGVGPGAKDTPRTVELSLVESEMFLSNDCAHAGTSSASVYIVAR